MRKAFSAFVVTLLVWLAVTWAFDPISLAIGVLLSATVAPAPSKRAT